MNPRLTGPLFWVSPTCSSSHFKENSMGNEGVSGQPGGKSLQFSQRGPTLTRSQRMQLLLGIHFHW